MQIIRQVILLDYCALLFDSDVVIFKDPVSTILAYENYDLIAQKDAGICAGFMLRLSMV